MCFCRCAEMLMQQHLTLLMRRCTLRVKGRWSSHMCSIKSDMACLLQLLPC